MTNPWGPPVGASQPESKGPCEHPNPHLQRVLPNEKGWYKCEQCGGSLEKPDWVSYDPMTVTVSRGRRS